ncbi:MAG: CinA family protein [Rickettsiales bacterium]|nr:CinA family protein [Rickettsiales bacterium]
MDEAALKNRYGDELVQRVQTLLAKAKAHRIKIATAESLTAGGIAHLLYSLDTDHSVLSSGKAVYNNNAKAEMLGVSREDLAYYEAVSEPVVRQMAEGALANSDAQISVSVTGYSGPWGDESRNIDGSTIFVGTSHVQPDGTYATQAEELHFDKLRSLDVRKTIIAAIGALELSLDASIAQQAELQGTIASKVQATSAQDPWVRAITDANRAVYQDQSGEPTDQLLMQEYGAAITQRIRKLHKDAVGNRQTIAVGGDGTISEVAHMLTILNGASKVVDRSYILPNRAAQDHILPLDAKLSPEDHAKAMAAHIIRTSPATMAISAYSVDNSHAIMAIATKNPEQTHAFPIHFSGTKPVTRQVAEHALTLLERALEPSQEHTRCG